MTYGGKLLKMESVSCHVSTLVNALQSLIDSIHSAIAEYERNPQPGLEYAHQKWLNRALPLLSTDKNKLQEALHVVKSPESRNLILTIASNELGLAKNLDSFRSDFAGSLFESLLNRNVDAVVCSASGVVQALAKENSDSLRGGMLRGA